MEDIFAKISCTYCEEEITGIRVQCCVCKDFDICLQCFSNGAEIGAHKNDHAYKLVEHWNVSIFGGRGNWTGGEELQLLDAVELFGFGNWEMIASKHFETRTPEEVRDEYIARYLDGNIGKATWAESRDKVLKIIDHVPEDNGPLSPAVIARLPPLDATPEEAQELGYKTHRDDYEREYDMEAEQLVSTLTLDTKVDTDVEVALKLSIIDMYTRRLRVRAKQKRMVRDYQLVAKFFVSQRKDNKGPLSKDQRELRDNLKVFSQFLTSSEHERLVNNLEREKELRHRLGELMRYRGLGLTTQEEVMHYEQHMAYQKQQQQRLSRSGSSGFPIQESPAKNGKSEENQSSSEKRPAWPPSDEASSDVTCNSSTSDSVEPVSPDALPLGSLLSQHEIQLCKLLNLQPVQYTTLKSLIIQENLLPSNSVRVHTNDQEASVRDVVAQYLSHSGWLPGVSVV